MYGCRFFVRKSDSFLFIKHCLKSARAISSLEVLHASAEAQTGLARLSLYMEKSCTISYSFPVVEFMPYFCYNGRAYVFQIHP